MVGGRAAREGLVAGPFYLDAFAERQWDDPNYAGARPKVPKAEFVRRVHELHEAAGGGFADGYAPFCKHVFVPNFVGAAVNCLAITPENEHLVRSGYHARKPGELAVLSRWFPLAAVGPLPEAKMLDIILYSRAQIVLERIAQDGLSEAGAEAELPEVPWGIISIKAQDEAFETPMQVRRGPNCPPIAPHSIRPSDRNARSPSRRCATPWAGPRGAAACHWTTPSTRRPWTTGQIGRRSCRRWTFFNRSTRGRVVGVRLPRGRLRGGVRAPAPGVPSPLRHVLPALQTSQVWRKKEFAVSRRPRAAGSRGPSALRAEAATHRRLAASCRWRRASP